MKRLLLPLLLIAHTATVTSPVQAQQPPQPAIEIRLKGVNELLDRFEYFAKLVDQEDAGAQLAQLIQGFADAKKGIEGIDPARPIGAYAVVDPNPIQSQVVVMLPIADEKAFLELLTGKLSLDPKQQDGGVYQLQVPNVPVPLFFKFADNTCYVTGLTPAALDNKRRVSPKQFFSATESGLLSLAVRLDRLPADIKKTALGQLELQLANAKDKKEPKETPAQTALKGWILDRVAEAITAVFADGREFRVRLVADPKGDDLALEASLDAASGSTLAQTFAGLSSSSRTTTTALPTSGAIGTFGVTGTLGAKAKASLATVVDELIDETLKNAKAKDRPAAKMILNALAPTFKSGLIDFHMAMSAGDKPEQFRVLAALAVEEGSKIETTLKQFAPFLPESAPKFEFDQAKAGGLSLHKMTNPKQASEPLGDTAWLVTGEKRVLIGFAPNEAGVRAAAEMRPKPAPLVDGTLSVARLLAAAKTALPPATSEMLVKRVFGEAGPAGNDVVSFRVEGGNALRLRFAGKGKALQLAVLTDKERKKQ